jgi:CRP/FNR family transcriptional regulator
MTESEISALFPTLEKELVEEMSSVGSIKSYADGEEILRSGQNIRAAILVLEGLVKVYREDENGAEFFMYYLDPGKACAITLVCALGKETSGLMAKAVLQSVVLSIPLDHIDRWMGKYKSWAQFAVSNYRERFEELLQTIDHIAFRNMDERLLFYLKRYQQKHQTNTISLTFTEIAGDLNSSREVISRLMKKLSEKGVIRLGRSEVEILDLDAALL